LNGAEDPDALFQVGQRLHITQLVYLWPLENHIAQVLPDGGKQEIIHFRTDIHGLIRHTLPLRDVSNNLKVFFAQQCSLILNVVGTNGSQYDLDSLPDARQRTLRLMQNLQSVGLGGHQAQRIFAEVMSDTLSSYIKTTYAGQWTSQSQVVEQLHHWIENTFARFVVEILAFMKERSTMAADRVTEIMHTDVERWQEMGINRLGVLRTDELFNVIVDWDDSRGAIEDLKRYVTVPSSRTYLTTTFSNVVSHRLLQPGASTYEILQMYISIIRAFTMLDPKGVLLDRVARPIRRYLRERDDTVTIVVGGLLADPEDEAMARDALTELAVEMSKSTESKGADDGDDGELDFDDLNWMPDPVDAGPEYKKSKNSDVIGSIVSLFESKDVFVKEFQNILGERLLKKEYEFDREIRVMELLKLRFGEAALQACEVMLRDIQDSRRVDTVIHKDQVLDSGDGSGSELHSRILSHLFWPSLHSETFFIPPEISTLQSRYSAGFENLKQSRKLTWLHALGQVTVTLDLEDRTVIEEVQTWQASVIHAFQPSPTEDASRPVTRTFDELLSRLEMTDSLLQNALTFWIGKLILKQTSTSPPTYTVLETLSDEDAAHPGTLSAANAAAAEVATAAAAPAVLSEHEVAQEKMEVYSQYVVGMLTNGGPMPLQQIVMMLKLTVAGGFPFGNEELKLYLEEEVRGGKLDFAGGLYKIKH
jgi:anaphase-promoting complex subunit 2